VRRAVFDEPNLLAAAGLVPVVALADRVGLQELADQFLTIPTDKGANAGLKVTSLVAGMVAGADSIDDMAILRHAGMRRIFDACYAPSTLGSFLRSFRFGHVRQLDAVAARTLIGLGQQVPLLPGIDDYALADMDDLIIEVHGYAKQGAGFGYTQVRGLNSFIGTVSTPRAAPVIVAQRLRKGSCGSARGAGRLVADTLATVKRLRPAGATGPVLLRADSAFYGHKVLAAARRAKAAVSITVRQTKKIKAVIAAIPDNAWTTIKYPQAVFDQPSGRWISRAEVAEIGFTAFTSRKEKEKGPGPSGGPPHPGAQPENRYRTNHPVRHLAVPRVLHDQHPGYRHRGQDPPRTRHHRAGPRRPQTAPWPICRRNRSQLIPRGWCWP
jgi:hypothetical protein